MPDDQDRGTGQPELPAASTPQYVTHIDSVQGTVNIGPTIQAGRPAPAVEEPLDDGDYDLAAIRRLLTVSFTAEELRRFCQDRPTFRPIVYRFGPGHGLDDMVQEVIDYCATLLLWEELLAAVAEVNPRQYHRFEPTLRPAAPAVTPAGLPDTLFDELRQHVRTYAPQALQAQALEQVSALRAALAASPPDLATAEASWHWFDGELPALAGAVLRLILDAGRHLADGADGDLLTEFQRRFGEF